MSNQPSIPEFEPRILDELPINEKILVRFGTSWCGPCQFLTDKLLKLQDEQYSIYTVDVDKRPELMIKYNIKAFPTGIIFQNGCEYKRFMGIKSIDNLRKYLK